MPQLEPYSTFANALAGLGLPFQAGDILVVTRGAVSFQIPVGDVLSGLTYDYVQPVTGNTITATSGLGAFRIDPAGALATLHMVMPPAPLDGQLFEASTTQDISALTVTAPGTATLAGTSGGPFVLAANGGVGWQYDLALDKWLPRF